MLFIIINSLYLLPIPFCFYLFWREYLVTKKVGELSLGLFASILPALNIIYALALFVDKGKPEDEGYLGYKLYLNSTSKCLDCDITSRQYQIKTRKSIECPQCGGREFSREKYGDNKKYPCAPKISEFGIIKKIIVDNKLDKLKKEMKDLEYYDKELEAWNKLQKKKLGEMGQR